MKTKQCVVPGCQKSRSHAFNNLCNPHYEELIARNIKKMIEEEKQKKETK